MATAELADKESWAFRQEEATREQRRADALWWPIEINLSALGPAREGYEATFIGLPTGPAPASEEDLATLREEVDAMQLQLAALQEARDAHGTEQQALEDRLDRTKEQVLDLDSAQKEQAALVVDHGSQLNTIEVAMQQATVLRNELVVLQTQVEHMAGWVRDQTSLSEDLAATANELLTHGKNVDLRTEGLRQSVVELTTGLLEARVRMLAEVDSLRAEIAAAIGMFNEKYTSTEEQVRQFTGIAEAGLLHNHETRLAALTAEWEATRSAWDADLAGVQRDVSTLLRLKADSSSRNTRLHQSIQQTLRLLQDQITQLQAEAALPITTAPTGARPLSPSQAVTNPVYYNPAVAVQALRERLHAADRPERETLIRNMAARRVWTRATIVPADVEVALQQEAAGYRLD